jgi:bifunctional DNase/RNase
VDAGPGGDSGVVLLTDEAHAVVLPIGIGGTEALSISLRFEREKYPRPLTHDLLDAAVRRLGGKLYEVQIDELKNGVFLGRIFLRKGNQVLDLDARPSDAIALALGDGVPIYVARGVLDEAGQRPDGESPAEEPRAER